MSVSYKKLWKLLIDKDMKKKDLSKRGLVHRSMSMRIPLVSRKSGIEKTAISKYLPFHKQLKTKYLNCVPRIGRILCRQVRVNGFIRT